VLEEMAFIEASIESNRNSSARLSFFRKGKKAEIDAEIERLLIRHSQLEEQLNHVTFCLLKEHWLAFVKSVDSEAHDSRLIHATNHQQSLGQLRR
jgi:hypothetical protein